MYNYSCRGCSKNVWKTTINNLVWDVVLSPLCRCENRGSKELRDGPWVKPTWPHQDSDGVLWAQIPCSSLCPSMWILPTDVPRAPSHSLQRHPEQDPEARKFASPSHLAPGCERLKSAGMTTWSIFPLCLQARSSPRAFREKRKPHMLSQVMPHSITCVCGLRHGQNLGYASQWRAATLATQILSTP